VSESSESVLAGTKRPPFRLVVRAVHESGARLSVRPAVSEEFVVSRRSLRRPSSSRPAFAGWNARSRLRVGLWQYDEQSTHDLQ